MNKKIRSSIILLLATTIWGSAFVAQRMGMDHIGPYTFQAARCFLALVVLIPISVFSDMKKKDQSTYFKRWKDKKLWKAGLLCGIPLFIACNLQQLGLVDTDAGKSAFLTAMYIVFVPIIGLLAKRKPTWTIPVSVVLAVAGLYFLSCVGMTAINRSDLLLLGCAAAFALQITAVDLFANQVDAIRLSMLQALVCATLTCIPMAIFETPTWAGIREASLPIAYAGCLSMGMSYTLQIVGQKNLEPAVASLIMSLESVFAVLTGCIVLHERLNNYEILGCVLVFSAVIVSQLPTRRKIKTQ